MQDLFFFQEQYIPFLEVRNKWMMWDFCLFGSLHIAYLPTTTSMDGNRQGSIKWWDQRFQVGLSHPCQNFTMEGGWSDFVAPQLNCYATKNTTKYVLFSLSNIYACLYANMYTCRYMHICRFTNVRTVHTKWVIPAAVLCRNLSEQLSLQTGRHPS